MNSPIAWNRTRPTVAGTHGAVASAHPLASQVGLDMLRGGGNAVDAAVATAVALNVVEPYMSGAGGVGFLLLHLAGGQTKTLNFSGRTPAAASAGQLEAAEQDTHPRACLIPGNVAGWLEALRAQGTKPADEIFAPAVRLAEQGFALHPVNASLLEKTLPRLNGAGQEIYGGTPLRIGAVLTQPQLGASLRRIAEQGPELFYEGELGATIADYVQSQGGFLTRQDLAGYKPDWQTPISTTYRGFEVKTCPPNSEGFQILETLRLLETTDLQALGHNSLEYIHLLSEVMKLATADRIRWGGDPDFQTVPLDRLLSEPYIKERREWINHEKASRSEGERWEELRAPDTVAPGKIDGLTTHLAAIDEAGNVASITQSLGNGFGSGVFVPGTGITLNNFLFWSEIDPACPTPNRLEGGRRPSNPMAPVHVFRDGRFWFSMATPGSYGILQTTVQMILNVIEFKADPQLAIEAPRFRLWEDRRMQIEDRIDPIVRQQLAARGHSLESVGDFSVLVGGGQSVMVDLLSGARLAGADPRRDGYALAY